MGPSDDRPAVDQDVRIQPQAGMRVQGMFNQCHAGHDLTQPDAFLYVNSGNRYCRLCSTETKDGKRKRRTFNLT